MFHTNRNWRKIACAAVILVAPLLAGCRSKGCGPGGCSGGNGSCSNGSCGAPVSTYSHQADSPTYQSIPAANEDFMNGSGTS